MIHYYEGTVFNTPAKTIVNTVNCVGVMGAGIALEFKLRYPEMYETYVKTCKENKMNIGRPKLFKYSKDLWIMNFPTKKHWRAPSDISYIEEGLKYFAENYKKVDIESIAFPKLGTSNGGLKWTEVKTVMEKYLGSVSIDIYICLDEKEQAEGVEKHMLKKLNNSEPEMLIEKVALTKKQAYIVHNHLPLDRFWKLNKVKGIGKRTYEKLFSYYYKKTFVIEKPKNANKKSQIEEQLSLF